MNRLGVWVIAAVAALAVMAAGLAMARPYTFNGSLIDPAQPAPDFTLRQAGGETFTLSEQRGKVNLIFYGYTACPDVCPLTLAEMKRVKAKLGSRSERVNFIFITVDPQRDTPERMGQYVSGFDENFVGLSGTEAELEPVYKNYGVYRKLQDTGSAVSYLVDHTAITYLVDTDNHLRLTYAFGTHPEEIAADINELLKEAR